MAKIYITMEGGICQGVSSDDPALVGLEYVTIDYDTEGNEEENRIDVQQYDGSWAEAIIGGGVVDELGVKIEEPEEAPSTVCYKE